MAGSYLFYNELHYNGLMTDWGKKKHFITLQMPFLFH